MAPAAYIYITGLFSNLVNRLFPSLYSYEDPFLHFIYISRFFIVVIPLRFCSSAPRETELTILALSLPLYHADMSHFLLQEYAVSPRGVAALTSPQVLLRHMQSHSIHCIASGGQTPNFKFFFFAQKQEEPSNFLVECIINTATAKAQIKVKADDQSASQAFSTLFQSALSNFGMP